MQISTIVLWPIDASKAYRTIQFEAGRVNYIVGGPDTGKSSVWQIIDYCLCSSSLRVPIGVARDLVSWYGVVFHKDGAELLVARRNMSITGSKSEYMVLRDEKIQLPNNPKRNVSAESQVKELLSKEFDIFLQSIDYEILSAMEGQPIGKFSYRDLLILNHLMQYALVNPGSFVTEANFSSVIKLKKLLPAILYPSSQGFYKIKKSLHAKLEVQLQTMSEEVSFLRERLTRLYSEANRLGLVENYIPPAHFVDRPAEAYRIDLESIFNKSNFVYADKDEEEHPAQPNDLRKIFLLGSIRECLRFSALLNKVRSLKERHLLLESEIIHLSGMKSKRGDSSRNTRTLTDLIHSYAKSMQLDFLEYEPVFDEHEAVLKLRRSSGEDFLLYQLGSPQNYVGYNLATFLGFHELLLRQPSPFVLPFLVIDHPSHSFLATPNDPDTFRLQAIYHTLDAAVLRMGGAFQVIVLDRKPPVERKNLTASILLENWDTDDGNTLIPKNWKTA